MRFFPSIFFPLGHVHYGQPWGREHGWRQPGKRQQCRERDACAARGTLRHTTVYDCHSFVDTCLSCHGSSSEGRGETATCARDQGNDDNRKRKYP